MSAFKHQCLLASVLVYIFCAKVEATQLQGIDSQKFNQVSSSKPRSEHIAKEDQLSLPEGGAVIKGMDVELTLEEINLYGLNIYSSKEIEQIISTALVVHNRQASTPNVATNLKVTDKGNGHYTITVSTKTYLSLVYAIAQEITQKYQKDKYFLSRAVVPAQNIDQNRGRVDVCVVEGYLASAPTVEIKDSQGNLERLKSTLAERMEPLVGKKALNFNEFERQLLLMRDMPGVNIQTTFRQQSTGKNADTSATSSGHGGCQQAFANGAGATSLSVALGIEAFDGAVSADNYGVDSVGPWIARFNFGANSRFLPGDRYTFDASISPDNKELQSYGVTAQVPLGDKGWKLNASHRQGDARPGAEFKDLKVKNNTQVSEVGVEYPWIRSRHENLSVQSKLKFQDVDTDLLGASYIRDRIRTAHLKATYDKADENNGVHWLDLEVTQGLDTAGATPKSSKVSSRPEQAAPSFTKYTAEYKYFKGLDASLTWVNGVKGQYVDQPLFASEEFEMGGRGYGRGADIGILTGDKGIAATSQIEYTTNNTTGNYKYYGFVDHGKVWQLDTNLKDVQKQGKMTSVGAGVNFEARNGFYMNMEVARPVHLSGGDTTGMKKETNTYIGVGYKF